MPNSNSSVRYTVTVTNIGNVDMGILSIDVVGTLTSNGTSKNLDYEVSGYTEESKLCNTNNVCSGGISKTFYITIKYALNN